MENTYINTMYIYDLNIRMLLCGEIKYESTLRKKNSFVSDPSKHKSGFESANDPAAGTTLY